MYGSVRKGYDGKAKPEAEWNVKADAKSCQKVFTASWDMTITPLDTCSLVRLKGAKFKTLRDSNAPIAKALLENYDIWAKGRPTESSVLFDTVAVYLSFSQALCTMEKLPIRVTDDGMTVIDPQQGKLMNVATTWKDMGGFEDLLIRRLTTPALATDANRP
jgi:inosine-uridine nucleoside N-ribohydrolase